VKLGLFGINIGLFANDPSAAVSVARAAERAGWDSVWTGEHFVLPDPETPDSPAPRDTPFLDPWIALTNIAGATETLLLGTGVTVVPLYQPVALAKQVVSLDRVSNGRLLFGVGVGYLGAEFDAFGVSVATRGKATDDALDVVHALWREASPVATYLGRTIRHVRAEPRPLRADGPPLVVGGYAPASYKRAVRRGHGWYGFDLDPAAARRAIDGLHRAAAEVDRPTTLGPLEISVTPPGRCEINATLVEEYRSLGVSRLVVHPPWRHVRNVGHLVDFIEATAADVGR
jgi:probable F420-dependent oxidoreductase